MTMDQQAVKDAIGVFGDRAAQFVALTLQDADSFVADIERAMTDGDQDAASLAAHSLKSIMKQINAASVSDIALEIETKGKEGRLQDCGPKVVQLREQYNALKGFLETLDGT